MALSDLTDPAAVQRALSEFDDLGRDRFLAKYGFMKSRSYFLISDGRAYDSKAIVGAAHGYQHPELGPLAAGDFSGGNATVRARLEALGFTVVVTEPRNAPVRPLALWEDYDRRDVHDIFAPDTPFTPGAGLWGIQGIVEYQPGEFVLFVTFGSEQGDHVFDEGITTSGVVSWQSQPNQRLDTPTINGFIAHDSARGNVRLFLRTREVDPGGQITPYTYLGCLAYLTHDAERERPVHFQWQVIDSWPPPEPVLARMGLVLTGDDPPAPIELSATPSIPTGLADPQRDAIASATITVILVQTAPPTVSARNGRRTADFRGRKAPDRSTQDAKNRALGLAGELAVLAYERQRLIVNGRQDLAERVRHVAALEGDGAGYDVESFELDESPKFIEVKTTRDGPETAFFVSSNEVEFSRRHAAHYVLCRLYDFDAATGGGHFYTSRGSLIDDQCVALEPVLFRGRVSARALAANDE